MKHFFITLLCMLCGLGLMAQHKKEWNQAAPLIPEDFKAQAPNVQGTQNAYAHIGVEYQIMNYEVLGSKNFNKNVSCILFPASSWIDSGEQSAALIRFQQTIFDLNELLARRLRKQFLEERKRLLKGETDAIYAEVSAEISPLITRYVQETAYGSLGEKQLEWELQIKSWLDELLEYCKTCTPAKKKKS